MGSRRRRLLLVGSLLFFTLLYPFILLVKLKVAPAGKTSSLENDEEEIVEYTLPSLENIISSVTDLDFQAALLEHGSQFQEIPEGTPRLNIIIASSWRSGSTFLGEILAAYPGTYYHYEPFMHEGIVQVSSNSVPNFLSSLLRCDYNDKVPYLHFAYGTTEVFMRNSRLWRFCTSMPRFKCFMPEILGKLCSFFPIHVMKLVRVRLSLLSSLLKSAKLKIIFLTRDPRAVMSSRKLNVDWCTTEDCRSAREFCSGLMNDVNTYFTLKQKYPDRILLVRYEDLANNPYLKSQFILNFTGLNMHESVRTYLKEHVNSEFEAPWSTIHDPKTRSAKWMSVTPWNIVVETQYHCREAMRRLGYRPFDLQREMQSGNSVHLINT